MLSSYSNFKRAVSVLAVAALFFLSAAAGYAATEKSFPCADAKALMAASMRAGYGYLATAISDRGFVTQFYLDMNTGRWLMLGVDNDLKACVLLNGTDWRFALVREG